MRKVSNCRLILIALPFFLNSAQSQSGGFIYAVTAIDHGSNEWVALRKLDTRMGKFGSMLFNIKSALQTINSSGKKDSSFNSGVAAIAYDHNNNRLFYVSMNNDQLQYINLATMASFSVTGQTFSKAGNYMAQTAGPITRLVIAPDNYGYTITGANHLIRFTTGAAPTLTDMGELVDDLHNNEKTITNTCSNQGGDMIADDAGNLYLITASNRVYKVNIETRKTSFLAIIAGLPASFTTNGAAVDENGKLIVSSSLFANASFLVDPETWKAMPAPANDQFFGVADLASSNVLHKSKSSAIVFSNWSFSQNNKIKVFPNPVLYDQVNIQLNDLSTGNYTIELVSALGKTVTQQKVVITGNAQTEALHIPTISAQGFYYIRVLNEKQNIVSVQKLAIERE